MTLILSGTDGLSDVDGSAATPAIRGTDANTGIFFPAADTVGVSTGGSERMRITSAGNLGVNTTTPATEGANAKIAIVGAAAQNASTLATSNSQAAFTIRADANSGYCMNFGNLVTSGFPYLQGAVFNGGASSSDISLNPFGGNVGIGTSSPSSKFDVVGGRSTFAANSENFSVYLRYNNSTNGFYIGSPSADVMAFSASSGAERMRINSNGTVGIGVAGQSAVSGVSGYLSVKNTANDGAWGLAIETTGATTNRGIGIVYGNTPNSTGQEFAYWLDSTTLRFSVRSNGGIANYSANNVNLSDERTKTDIQDAGSYLAKICAIPVRTFKYKDQTDDLLNLGVIAQEVEIVAPELVDASGFGETPEDGVPLKAIYQTDLQYALMKCIQEQQALITALTARIEALETK